MHLQNNCDYMVNSINIQYKITITIRKKIINSESSRLFNKVLNCWKNKAV